MIKPLFTFTPSAKELYLLNQPFETFKKEKEEFVNTDEYACFWNSRISSYHNPLENEPNWFRYPNLYDLEIIIAGIDDQDTKLSAQEILNFTAQNNGFALSRDNLFMLWSVYRKELKAYIEQRKQSFSIIAMAPTEMLPIHSNGPKICPMLQITYDSERYCVNRVNYDWSWIDKSENMNIKNFAFFKKKVV
ncbi:MAG: hypothetical protein WCH65_01630 [bacterium]